MVNYREVLLKYYGDIHWKCGKTYESIEWYDETSEKPTKEKLDELYELYLLEQVRQERNQLLQDSDFRVLVDYVKDKDLWIEYRQKLREFPSIWVKDMEFPTPPSD